MLRISAAFGSVTLWLAATAPHRVPTALRAVHACGRGRVTMVCGLAQQLRGAPMLSGAPKAASVDSKRRDPKSPS